MPPLVFLDLGVARTKGIAPLWDSAFGGARPAAHPAAKPFQRLNGSVTPARIRMPRRTGFEPRLRATPYGANDVTSKAGPKAAELRAYGEVS